MIDGKIVYSKDIGSGKAGSEKVDGLSADFTLFLLLLLFTKSYKKHFSV